MDNGKKYVDEYLSVGEQLFLEIVSGRGWTKRVKTRFRGWVSGEYILMDSPTAPGELAYVMKDAPCVVRFIHEGCACGFDGKILDWCDMGLPFFRVTWPKAVQVLHVRKHARIPLKLECTIEHSAGHCPGEVVDLSSGGCGLVSPRPYDDGTELRLSFDLPDGFPVRNLRATVCRSRQHEQGMFVGCNFIPDDDGDYSALFFFVSTTLSRMGLERLAERRVLVVHPSDADVHELLAAFDAAGIHAVAADNMVDAFYRLRMTKPGAVLLHVRQMIFSVVDVCAAIRQTPGFGRMPLLLMGGDERGQALVSKCGAQEWFSHECLVREPDLVVAACLRHAVRHG